MQIQALSLAALAAASSTMAISNVMVKRASGVKPLTPSSTDKFEIGGQCTMTWEPDTSGSSKWKSMTIDFMTGANLNMTKLANVATDLDGTDPSLTSYSWTCPEVDPPSAIYFYQWTRGDEQDPTWTTRFLIADADGNSVAPPESEQPEGDPIPWGQGKIVGSTSSGSSDSSSDSDSESTVASPSSQILTGSVATSASAATGLNAIPSTTPADSSSSTTPSSAGRMVPTSAGALLVIASLVHFLL